MQQRWESLVLDSRSTTADERIAADNVIRQMILDEEEAEEAQLLIPDNERKRKIRRRHRLAKSPVDEASSQAPAERMQVDGGDESADEDAINSDLDDSEDDLDGQQAEDDGPLGEMILCTWDKVNRVKNKVCCFVIVLLIKMDVLNIF